jgi:hypothetical protein
MEILLEDLRYLLRVLGRAPSFVLFIAITLALGVGVNTATFRLMNALLEKSLPAEHANELVVADDPMAHFRTFDTPSRGDVFSYKLCAGWRSANEVFPDTLVSGERPCIGVPYTGQTRNTLIVEQLMGTRRCFSAAPRRIAALWRSRSWLCWL